MFIRDRQAGTTRRISVAQGGGQANGFSSGSSISADGRFVVFDTDATNIVAGDTNAAVDVFVRDRGNSTTRRVSLSASNNQGNQGSYFESISANAQIVAFFSFASNLVPGDTNGKGDVFVRSPGP